MRVVELQIHLRPAAKCLCHSGVRIETVGHQRRHAIRLDVQLRRILVHPIQLPGGERVESRNGGPRGLGDGALNREIGQWLAEGA